MHSWVSVRLSLDDQNAAVCIRTDAETVGPTGVEMEALTGAHPSWNCCPTEALKHCQYQLLPSQGWRCMTW